jgi:hypothetical protein
MKPMKRARSTAYPVLDLAAAYRILRQNLAGIGTAELDRDEIARKIGYIDAQGGLAARKVGALVHYGLLVRRGSRYGLSPLGLHLQGLDIRDAEFHSAIRSAFEQPALFRLILDRFRSVGRIPPSLPLELETFGITKKASSDAVEVFRSSALFAGVLDTEGFFNPALAAPSSISSTQEAKPPAQEPEEDDGVTVTEREVEKVKVVLILPRGRKASLVLPQPFDIDDYRALKDSFLSIYKLLPAHLEIDISEKQGSGSHGRGKSPESTPPLRFRK